MTALRESEKDPRSGGASRGYGNERFNLQRARRQHIASRDLARIEAVEEPTFALFGCAVGEGIGYDIALHLLLQAVVADGRSSLQSLIDVAWIEEVVLLLSAAALLFRRPLTVDVGPGASSHIQNDR